MMLHNSKTIGLAPVSASPPPQPPASHSSSPQHKPVFLSKAERFASEQGKGQQGPGPGAYGESRLKQTVDFRSGRKEGGGTHYGVAREHQWIMGSERLSFLKDRRESLGPGQYEHGSSLVVGSHSDWGRGERFRRQQPKIAAIVGPGKYHDSGLVTTKGKTLPLSVFKSKTPKSFFEALISKEERLQRSRNPEEDDEEEEVVKFEEAQYPTRRKADNLSPVFLSKSKRPQLINGHSPCGLGPGTYASEQGQRRRSEKESSVVSAMHYRANPSLVPKQQLLSKVQSPGPGSYSIERKASIESLASGQQHSSLPKENRFREGLATSKEEGPGPGEYNQQRFSMIREEEMVGRGRAGFGRKAEKVHGFGVAARSTLRRGEKVPFGEYNTKNYDIEYRLMKQMEHFEKLKLMEVTLPVFNRKGR